MHCRLARLSLLLGLLLAAGAVHAQQQFLAVDHAKRVKRFRIFPGEAVGIRLRGERQYFRYELQGMRNDSLFVGLPGNRSDVIPLGSITGVRWYRNGEGGSLVRMLSGVLATGAGALFVVRGVNSVSQGLYPVYPAWSIAAVGGGLLSAYLLNRTQRRTLPLGRRWEVKIVYLNIGGDSRTVLPEGATARPDDQ